MPNFIRIKSPPYHWLVNDTYRRLLEGVLIGKEKLLYEQAASAPIKDNNARTIFILPLLVPKAFGTGWPLQDAPLREFFVKRYKFKLGLFNIIKSIFAPASALTELRNSNYLINKNKNTAYPIGAVEKKKWGITVDSFLLLRKMDGVTTMNDASIDGLPRPQKNTLLQTLGKLIRDIHNINFLHRDLHTGNILIKNPIAGMETAELSIIDLHRAYVLPDGISRSRKMFNIAQLAFSIWRTLPFTDVVRFLKAYRYLDLRPDRLKDFYREIFERMLRIRHQLYQRRAKRCLRSGSRYCAARLNTPGNIYQTFSRRLAADWPLLSLVTAHNEMVRNNSFPLKHHVIKHTATRSITVYEHQQAGEKIYIKEYRYISFISRLKSLFGYHPAKMAWLNGNAFEIRGVLTAKPLTLVVERDPFWLWARRAYLITQEVKGTTSNQYVMDAFISTTSAALRCRFVRAFAFAVSNLHNCGIFHCDLKANNILVQEIRNSFIPQSARWSFHFIDLDRVRFSPRISIGRRIKNLAQLNAAMPAVITRAERLRFWRFYASGLVPAGTKQEKNIIRQIMALTIKRHHIWP